MTTTPAKRITSLQRDLHAAGYDCSDIDQRYIWAACVNLHIRAHQVNRIWHYYPVDIPEIAAGLNLPRLSEASRPASPPAGDATLNEDTPLSPVPSAHSQQPHRTSTDLKAA